jgi:membrane protease YdiL (CAAX protease family)
LITLRRFFAALATCLVAGAATAVDLVDADAAYQRVVDGEHKAYRAVLDEYDRAAQRRSGDAAFMVARCRFIGLVYDNDVIGESPADTDIERCEADLRERFAAVPLAQLFLQEREWDDDTAAKGDALLAQSQGWPQELRCRLLDTVTQQHETAKNTARVGELAVEAVRLCADRQRVGKAVRHLVGQGLAQPASAMLTEAPPSTDTTVADERLRAALAHPDRALARSEVERHEAAGVKVDATLKARALFRAGDIQGAAGVLPSADDKAKGLRGPIAELRFDLALATGDALGAAALINRAPTTPADWWITLQRYLRVVSAEPLSAVRAPLVVFTGILGLVAVALMLLPALVVVPAHYRGLVRQRRGQTATPLFASVGLTRAWIALGLALLVPFAVTVGFGADPGGASSSSAFRTLAWSSVLQLLLLAPWAAQLGRDGWFGSLGWPQTRSLVLRAWLLLFVVSVLVGMVIVASGETGDTAQTRAVNAAVSDGMQGYGVLGTLVVLALVAPLCEELVFRGMLLGGLSRHLGFGASNFLQAVVFAAFHADPPRFPFYLALGLFAGWLVRRGGGLAAAFALHALNNSLFVLLRLAV